MEELEVRNVAIPAHTDRHLSGWALQYNVVTEIRNGGDTFKESLAKGCLDGLDLNQVKLFINHNDDYNVEPDNLKVELRDEGLHFSCDIPDTPIGNWLMDELDNLTGMSFGFVVEEETRSEDVRVIEKIAHLKEVSLLHKIDPAYPKTKICSKTKECTLEARAKEDARNAKALAIGLAILEQREKNFEDAKRMMLNVQKNYLHD